MYVMNMCIIVTTGSYIKCILELTSVFIPCQHHRHRYPSYTFFYEYREVFSGLCRLENVTIFIAFLTLLHYILQHKINSIKEGIHRYKIIKEDYEYLSFSQFQVKNPFLSPKTKFLDKLIFCNIYLFIETKIIRHHTRISNQIDFLYREEQNRIFRGPQKRGPGCHIFFTFSSLYCT